MTYLASIIVIRENAFFIIVDYASAMCQRAPSSSSPHICAPFTPIAEGDAVASELEGGSDDAIECRRTQQGQVAVGQHGRSLVPRTASGSAAPRSGADNLGDVGF